MVSNATPKFKQKQQKTDNKLLLLRNPMTTRSDQLVWKCKDAEQGGRDGAILWLWGAMTSPKFWEKN